MNDSNMPDRAPNIARLIQTVLLSTHDTFSLSFSTINSADADAALLANDEQGEPCS